MLKGILYKMRTREEPLYSRRHITYSSWSVNAAGTLVGGNFLMGLILFLKADSNIISFVTMAGLFGNLLQFVSPIVIERFPKRKKILIWSRAASSFLNIVMIGITPYLPIADRGKLTFIIFLFALMGVMGGVFGPAWGVWHIKSIPENIRKGYFSFIQVSVPILTFFIGLGGGLIADHMKETGQQITGFTILRIIALIFAAIDIYMLTRIKEYPNEIDTSELNLKSVLLNPLRSKGYRKSLIAIGLWSFIAYVGAPFYNAYLLDKVQMSYTYLNFVGALYLPTLLITTPLWNKVAQKINLFKTFGIFLAIYTVHLIGLAFVTSETKWIYPINVMLYYIEAASLNIVGSNLPYHNMPRANQSNYLGFYSAISNLCALFGMFVGQQFMNYTNGRPISLWGIEIVNYQYIMVFVSFLTLLSTFYVFFFLHDKPEDSAEAGDAEPAETAELSSQPTDVPADDPA